MKRLRREQQIGVLALALFAGSAGWFGVAAYRAQGGAGADRVALAREAFAAGATAKPLGPVPTWPAPASSARGPAWTYEIFTPPEIVYDEATQRFKALGPVDEAAATLSAPAAGLVFLGVEPEPFPLQLIGYVGEPGHYLGTFGNLPTGETLLLRAGDQVASLAVTVASLDIAWEATAIPDSMSVNERRATAIVTDTNTGKRTTLRQGQRALSDRWCARLALAGHPDSARLVRKGDEIAAGAARFRVEAVRLTPAEVVVTQILPGHEAGESQTLTPSASAAPSIP